MKYIGIGLLIILLLWFFIHLYLWNECRKKNGNQPNCITTPCPFIKGDCNFITLTPTAKSENEKCIENNKNKAEGDSCTNCIPDGSEQANFQGVIHNGICGQLLPNPPVNPPINNNNNPPVIVTTTDLEVVNPQGAIMYYQSTTQAGGTLYSPSNIVIPFGSSIKLIKFWQTSLNNMPLSGYYETDYKTYGASSGFFQTTDLKKK